MLKTADERQWGAALTTEVRRRFLSAEYVGGGDEEGEPNRQRQAREHSFTLIVLARAFDRQVRKLNRLAS